MGWLPIAWELFCFAYQKLVMERFKRTFSVRKKREGHHTEANKPHQWQEDERKVREGTCSFQVKVCLSCCHSCVVTKAKKFIVVSGGLTDLWPSVFGVLLLVLVLFKQLLMVYLHNYVVISSVRVFFWIPVVGPVYPWISRPLNWIISSRDILWNLSTKWKALLIFREPH